MKTLEKKIREHSKIVFNKTHSSEIVDYSCSSFKKGYETAQHEYEEKLRWIPVEEELPEPRNNKIIFKTEQQNMYVGFYGLSCNFYVQLADVLDKNIQINNVTHWREIL